MSSKDPSKKLGQLRYKIWMRKTLAEALRWFKEKLDLEAVQSDKIVEKVGATAPKKLITVKIVECKDLVSKLSKSVIPFFYY